MKIPRNMAMTFAERCKNVLLSNWRAKFHTVKADDKGSNTDVYTTTAKYVFQEGKPYIWIPDDDFTNVNTILDDRASLAVTSPFPGPLGYLLQSHNKTPLRVALTGEIQRRPQEKIQSDRENLKDALSAEQKAINEFRWSVTSILSSSGYPFRSIDMQILLDPRQAYVIYEFFLRSCSFIDCSGAVHEVSTEDVEAAMADSLSPFAAKIIDGINQSEVRRRALVFLCYTQMNAIAKDAYLLSIDRKGLDVLGKVPGSMLKDGSHEFEWQEFRLGLKEEADNVEAFCSQLAQMEEEAVGEIRSSNGLF